MKKNPTKIFIPPIVITKACALQLPFPLFKVSEKERESERASLTHTSFVDDVMSGGFVEWLFSTFVGCECPSGSYSLS